MKKAELAKSSTARRDARARACGIHWDVAAESFLAAALKYMMSECNTGCQRKFRQGRKSARWRRRESAGFLHHCMTIG
jgi:hypothetical protein